MINIEEYAGSLTFRDGIWFYTKNAQLSYPSEGNIVCYEIKDQSCWFKIRNLIIWEFLGSLKRESPVFDVGGGNGFASTYLSGKGLDTAMVKPGMEGCFNAKKRGAGAVEDKSRGKNVFSTSTIKGLEWAKLENHIWQQHNVLNINYPVNKVFAKLGFSNYKSETTLHLWL